MKDGPVHNTDALVLGGGIAGLQASLDLADQGYKVAIVEKTPSIGGNMIRLSKVFPTLDCASCITTPKMAAAAHHENIHLYTNSELQNLSKENGRFEALVRKKPRYVKEDQCIGCRQCEDQCPVYVSDPEQGDFVAKKAISIPFSNAIPQVACLDDQVCMLCGRCAQVCPKDAVDYFQQPQDLTIRSGTVIASTGYRLTSVQDKPQYGNGCLHNVISSLQMERLLAPHGPYNRVLRPADGKEPESVAFIQCAGSRDNSMGIPYCSRVCCMYAIKQAMLLSGALPLADITIYYMDIRAFGKGFEQFYQNSQAMGIEFVKGKVSWLSQEQDYQVRLNFEDQLESGATHRDHDLVVLSLGMVPEWSPASDTAPLSCAADGFLNTPHLQIDPTLSETQGLFVAGTASGPKDIPDTVSEAGAAAMKASSYLESFNPAFQ